MIIKYVHSSNPEVEKSMNTVAHRAIDENFARSLFGNSKKRTQEEYDKWLQEKLEKEKAEGKILRYKVEGE